MYFQQADDTSHFVNQTIRLLKENNSTISSYFVASPLFGHLWTLGLSPVCNLIPELLCEFIRVIEDEELPQKV